MFSHLIFGRRWFVLFYFDQSNRSDRWLIIRFRPSNHLRRFSGLSWRGSSSQFLLRWTENKTKQWSWFMFWSMIEELVIYLLDELNLKLIMLIEKLIIGTDLRPFKFGCMLLKELHFLNCMLWESCSSKRD